MPADPRPSIEVEIGPFRTSDADRAAELELILFPRQDPWSRQQFVDTLSQPHVQMWAARTVATTGELPDAALAGFAVLAGFGPEGDREFEVFDIAVDPDYQGFGIGRALLRAMLAVADAESAPVHLEVATGNVPARTLYEARGFVAVGLRRNYYRPSGEDAYAMVRPAVIRDSGLEPEPESGPGPERSERSSEVEAAHETEVGQ